MGIPFLVFWILILLGRSDLGIKGVLSCIAIWVALLAGFMYFEISPYYFVVPQAVLDIVLILSIFGGDIRLRGS